MDGNVSRRARASEIDFLQTTTTRIRARRRILWIVDPPREVNFGSPVGNRIVGRVRINGFDSGNINVGIVPPATTFAATAPVLGNLVHMEFERALVVVHIAQLQQQAFIKRIRKCQP